MTLIDELQKLRELIAPLAKVELGIHKTIQAIPGSSGESYYQSWDDGEYFARQALTLLDNLIAQHKDAGWIPIEENPKLDYLEFELGNSEEGWTCYGSYWPVEFDENSNPIRYAWRNNADGCYQDIFPTHYRIPTPPAKTKTKTDSEGV